MCKRILGRRVKLVQKARRESKLIRGVVIDGSEAV
jgi:hypothetical protein